MTQNRRKFLTKLSTMGFFPIISPIQQIVQSEDVNSVIPGFKGKNKVGFNLLLWTASVSDKIKPVAERLKGIGYDGVECAMAESETAPYVDYGKFLKSIGMEATVVMALGKDEDPINESEAIRIKALEKLKWCIDRANDLGAKTICGPFHSAFANFRKRPPNEDEYKMSAEVLHKAGEYAAKSGIILAVEAINRFECYLCNTISQLTKLVNLVDHPHVKPMFDTHHANIEEKQIKDTVISMAGNLAHVHISENDRGTPGSGHIQFENIFSSLEKINYKGWLTIEAFSRNDVDFANSINVWREYNKPWDVAENGFRLIQEMQSKYTL